MRNKLKKLSTKNIGGRFVSVILPTEQEKEKNNRKIDSLERKIDELYEKSESDTKKIFDSVVLNVSDLSKSSLDLSQTERVLDLLNDEELKKVLKQSNQRYNMANYKKSIELKLGYAIGIRMGETEDLEELKALNDKITPEMIKNDYVFFTNLRSQISIRTQQVQKKLIIAQQRNNITPRIEEIIKSIATGNFNYIEAIEIINQEAEQKVKGKPQTNFTLTAQKEANQTIMQLRNVLIEQADQYPLVDPELAVKNLTQLDPLKPEMAINAVIKNMSARKQYEAAKKMCDKYIDLYHDSNNGLCSYTMSLKKDVSKGEIAQFVLQNLQSETTPTEQKEFLETLQTKLSKENLKMSSIILGKKDSSSKLNTLQDIFDDGEYVRTK